MKFETIKTLKTESFRRLTGIKRETFDHMTTILEEGLRLKKIRGGRPGKLSVPDMLLMSLEYLREYRTYFHTAKSYGVSESSAYKSIKWVEDTLIKHPKFCITWSKSPFKKRYGI